MWCANCRSDVAAEVSLDNQRIHCATCGSELALAAAGPNDPKTRSARELLERWSRNSPGQLLPPSPSAAASGPAAAAKSGGTRFRVDAGPAELAGPNADDDWSVAPAGEPLSPRRDPPHALAEAGPHFDVQAAIRTGRAAGSNSASVLGQVMAYLGVAVLTIGTALVLWGYFGDRPGYAPTGWLITTAGQMLLFLGVVTLVSGGMEQTSEEVARRMELLGERILRIEQATRGHGLKGPSPVPERAAAASRHERQVVEP